MLTENQVIDRFTDRFLQSVHPTRGSARFVIWERSARGLGTLGLRVGSIRLTWVLMYKHEGRSRMMTLGRYPVMSVAAAHAAAAKASSDLEQGVDPGTIATAAKSARLDEHAANRPLREFLDQYLREISVRKKSGGRELSTVRYWQSSSLAALPLSTIRGKDIANAIVHMQSGGLAPNTIRIYLALLSHLFNTARTAWGIESLTNPVDLVKGQRPKLPRGRTRRLVDDEQVRLMESAKVQDNDIGPLITWAIETAMRRGEIAAMRWDHLDRKARVLLIPETKTGTPRRVPLSTAALAVLDSLPRRIDGRVWGMRPDSISQAFERVCKLANIEGLTFHDLRHEATSRLFEKGLNPMEVAAITGHKTLQMLKRYTHLRAEDLVGRLG
jgi:integrase